MLPRVCSFACLLFCSIPFFAAKGTYSRSAVSVSLHCFQKQTCPVALVRSPDGIKTVQRTFQRERTFLLDRDIEFYVPDIELITASGHWNLPVPEDWVDFDVLWSPDSKFVAMTGNLNGYIESVRVYQITESDPVRITVTKMPSADMWRRFPPCRALHADPTVCEASQHNEEDFNFAAVAWADAHTLVLMSEVPCSSLWGGIMCQVMGYEVDLHSGNIVETMTARDFKQKWQHEMAWRFRIPDPPEWQN